jgi:hypothetical protein
MPRVTIRRKGIEKPLEEFHQRHPLEVGAPGPLAAFSLPLHELLMPIGIAQHFGRERADNLTKTQIGIGERRSSRKVRRKIAPITTVRQATGTTVIVLAPRFSMRP